MGVLVLFKDALELFYSPSLLGYYLYKEYREYNASLDSFPWKTQET